MGLSEKFKFISYNPLLYFILIDYSILYFLCAKIVREIGQSSILNKLYCKHSDPRIGFYDALPFCLSCYRQNNYHGSTNKSMLTIENIQPGQHEIPPVFEKQLFCKCFNIKLCGQMDVTVVHKRNKIFFSSDLKCSRLLAVSQNQTAL